MKYSIPRRSAYPSEEFIPVIFPECWKTGYFYVQKKNKCIWKFKIELLDEGGKASTGKTITIKWHTCAIAWRWFESSFQWVVCWKLGPHWGNIRKWILEEFTGDAALARIEVHSKRRCGETKLHYPTVNKSRIALQTYSQRRSSIHKSHSLKESKLIAQICKSQHGSTRRKQYDAPKHTML